VAGEWNAILRETRISKETFFFSPVVLTCLSLYLYCEKKEKLKNKAHIIKAM